MTKEELGKLLSQRGASKSLLSKPAVMERLYSICGIKTPLDVTCGFKKRELTEDEIRAMITVGNDGTILVDDKEGNLRRFEDLPNGDACYTNQSRREDSVDQPGIYIINSYGVDDSFQQDEDIGKENKYLITRNTPNGRVLVHERRGGSNKINEEVDDGNPVLDFIYYIKCPSRDLAREQYQISKEYISKEYPKAAKWYMERDEQIKSNPSIEERREVDPRDIPTDVVFEAERAGALEERIGEYRREVEALTNRLSEREAELDKAKKEKEEALKMLAKTQVMANRLYDTVVSIKDSVPGKIFFGRKLQDVPDKDRFLEAGKEIED